MTIPGMDGELVRRLQAELGASDPAMFDFDPDDPAAAAAIALTAGIARRQPFTMCIQREDGSIETIAVIEGNEDDETATTALTYSPDGTLSSLGAEVVALLVEPEFSRELRTITGE